MDLKRIEQLFEETAYERLGGSDDELRCANYLKQRCEELGMKSWLETFEVDMADVHEAVFEADGMQIPCLGYQCAGTHEVEAPLYYLTNTDPYSLSQVRGKIVMIDTIMRYWMYQDLLENGAVGFVTYTSSFDYDDRDIYQQELRSFISKGVKLPAVTLNVKDATALIQNGVTNARIVLKQNEYKGESRNVVAELPGETDEFITLTAHYDSTVLSQGAYDNMSGCIGLLGIAEYFLTHPHRYGLRFVFCGSEERGLLGSKAYTAAHEEELKKCVLNINLDMIGCAMGHFIACCTSEEKLVHYISYFGMETGFGIKSYQDVYSSDSTPFADKGVPAVSFARCAPGKAANIHTRFDTRAVMSAAQMLKDIDFLCAFTQRMACARFCPVARTMPDNMKEQLDYYLLRKRKPE